MEELAARERSPSLFANSQLLEVEKLRDITLEHAIKILSSATSGTMGELLKKERSPMLAEINFMRKHPEKCENIAVRLAHTEDGGGSISHRGESIEVYSVKLEINKAPSTITLAVGARFTELYMEKEKKLSELVIQENGRGVRYEKYA
ncbi:MAG: hypothetical protein WC588_01095 [Candidatus Micrarchaeia archaeon]